MKPKLKVQQYHSAASFLRNASKFLAQNENMNNLFWEVTFNWQSGKKIKWAGNVFLNHKIVLSAINMESGYVLLSTGKSEAVERLVDYGRTKHWDIKGIMGARESVEKFSLKWQNKGTYSAVNLTKRFTIFQSFRLPKENRPPDGGTLEIVQAGELEWPRIRLWATIFADEANPALDRQATILMAKSMLKNKCLYLLKEGMQSLGMAGFGRNTPNCMVINMVFTPPELRGRRYASYLVSSMVMMAKKRGFNSCLLFSDHLKEKNLYQAIGFEVAGDFCEMKLMRC